MPDISRCRCVALRAIRAHGIKDGSGSRLEKGGQEHGCDFFFINNVESTLFKHSFIGFAAALGLEC